MIGELRQDDREQLEKLTPLWRKDDIVIRLRAIVVVKYLRSSSIVLIENLVVGHVPSDST